MTERFFLVEVPLDGAPDQWFTLARCLTSEAAAELTRVLLEHGRPDVVRVKVEVQFSPGS